MEDGRTFTEQVALLIEELEMATPEFIISPDFVNISKRFLESFYNIKNKEDMMIYRQKVADSILCKKGTSKTFGKTLKLLIEEVKRRANPITHSTTRISAYKSAVFLQAALLNYSECSAKLTRNLMKDKNYIQANRLILHGVCEDDANLPVNQSILHFLKCTLTCTHNLLKFCGDEARFVLNEKGFYNVILKYKDSCRTDIKNLSLFILAYLTKDEQGLKLLEKTTIDIIITSLKDALENKDRKPDGFRPVELCACLEQIAKLEPIQAHLIAQNILSILRKVYRSGSRRTACAALLIVWTLAFNPELKSQVKKAFGNFVKWELNSFQKKRDRN
uniref:Uncharacterized protein n=1 Tax=Schistocephalus solidus TaxID=70667 RepID=A0A0X3P0J6_SCHSO